MLEKKKLTLHFSFNYLFYNYRQFFIKIIYIFNYYNINIKYNLYIIIKI